jgi:SEC-C motif-containing protein
MYMNCPCGSKKKYSACCKIAHQSLRMVKTAEQLMRSRYTAFVLADGDYLMDSHHSSSRPLKDKKAIVAWAKSVDWVELKIFDKKDGLENDTEGTVTFKAFFKENGELSSISEHSTFVKENECWYYLGFR